MTKPNWPLRARQRATLYSALRRFFTSQGYQEVETPVLVPRPGLEPHITAFEVPFVPELEARSACTLYLHTSPEYAMKRLVADGAGPIFQICKVFRNGEVSRLHNPEFTLLEFYRPNADYQVIMSELEGALAAAQQALGGDAPFNHLPYERVTMRDAIWSKTGLDLRQHKDVKSLRRAVEPTGIRVADTDGYEDVFFKLFLEKVEKTLGREAPTYLVEYPAALASLSRLKPGDPSVAERFELYVHGLELANGFSELTDAAEQRRRLVQEQEQRRLANRPVYPLDERFLEAVGRLPPCAGVAVGLDRVLMLMTGAARIEEVLLFPAHEFIA